MDLAGCMPHQCERQFVGGDSAAVVSHRNAFHAAFIEGDAQRHGACVERILEQFLDDRRGALDDFTGGDLADQLIGQRLNRPADGLCRCGVGGCGRGGVGRTQGEGIGHVEIIAVEPGG